MIDKRKIEEEMILQSNNRPWYTEEEWSAYIGGFQDATEWAQKEYIDSLWHDASEEPKTHTCVVVIMLRGSEQLCRLVSNFENWKTDAETHGYTKWCCLEDILPNTVWGL